MINLSEIRHKEDLLKKKRWINLSILGLCVVAAIGVILRSKILFPIPFFDYNRLLDAHFHFAFSGWVTLALVTLFVYDILPESLHSKPLYQKLLIGIVMAAWLLLFSSPLPPNNPLSSFFASIFIFSTYVFAWVFIRDIRKADVGKTVKLLAVAAIIFLVASSFGFFTLAYLFATKSLNSSAYRDALYTYLHFQYNGFFTLGVFAVIFNKLSGKITDISRERIHLFAVMLCCSIVPTLFLTFLWRDPNVFYKTAAVIGSITLILTLIWLGISALSLSTICKTLHPLVRYMGYLAIAAFSLKTLLQSLTIFPGVGDAVFGDRPVIIGFLHLVFLGFISLMLLAYFVQSGLLNIKFKITKTALVVFTTGVLLNELVLMTQGLGAMFIKSSDIFPWMLWGISILLLTGAVLTGFARIKSNR